MAKILIADDHGLVRDTLCAFPRSATDDQVSEACDFPSAAERLEADRDDDLLLLDDVMPGMNGLEGSDRARRVQGRDQAAPMVAILSGHSSPQLARGDRAAGAQGFAPKTLPAEAFVTAVRLLLSGQVFAPVDLLTQKPADARAPGGDLSTTREREVLAGLRRSLSNKVVPRELALQEVTVKLHVKTLCKKLAARNRTHAAMIKRNAALGWKASFGAAADCSPIRRSSNSIRSRASSSS